MVRSGTVIIESRGSKNEIGPGGYFGDDQLKADVGVSKLSSPPQAKPDYSAKAGAEAVVVGVLKLASCRKIMQTRHIGTPKAVTANGADQSMVDKKVNLDDLKRHTILGAGTFGQARKSARKYSHYWNDSGRLTISSLPLNDRFGWSRANRPRMVSVTHTL